MVEKQNDIETNSPSSPRETTRLLPDLPQLRRLYFRVITRGEWDVHWITKDIFAEELTGDPINDAVYNRTTISGAHITLKLQTSGIFRLHRRSSKEHSLKFRRLRHARVHTYYDGSFQPPAMW